jgi:DNA-binding LytR/AlgR family response regulator
MRKLNIRFQRDPELEEIDVLIRAPERDGEVEALIRRVSGKPPEGLTVTGADGALVRLMPEKILLVTMQGNTARIATETAVYTLRQTLQSIEQTLSDRDFLRISRSELINMNKIEKYDFTVKGELRLELTGGIETWAARRCIPAIRARLYGKE